MQFRDPVRARALLGALEQLTAHRAGGEPLSIMHVCGSHEQAIARFGLRAVLPPTLQVIMGPGCPVCVTDAPEVDEALLPVRPAVRAASELLGIDPLLVANEGKALLGVRPADEKAVLEALRAHPLGRDACRVGRCVAEPVGRVVLDTGFGRRLVVEPDGELLPRIC